MESSISSDLNFLKPVPAKYVLEHIQPTWVDLRWAYQAGWIDERGVLEFAYFCLESKDEDSQLVLALAGLLPQNKLGISATLDQIADSEGGGEGASPPIDWLKLLMAWAYDHRDRLADPLGVVEDLYCDFGHPGEIREFVRYLPPTDGHRPQEHSHRENLERLFSLWRDYVASSAST